MSDPDGVGVVLYAGRLVLLQKRDFKPRLFPGYWVLFGGQINNGEKPEAAAKREIEEELGYEIRKLSLLGTVRVVRDQSTPLMHYFRASGPIELSSLRLREGHGFAYFCQEELSLLQMRPEDRLALEEHFKLIGYGWESIEKSGK